MLREQAAMIFWAVTAIGGCIVLFKDDRYLTPTSILALGAAWLTFG